MVPKSSILKSSILIAVIFLLPVSAAYAVEMDDLDVTIRVIETNEVGDISHELSLPEMVIESSDDHEIETEGSGQVGLHVEPVGHEEEGVPESPEEQSPPEEIETQEDTHEKHEHQHEIEQPTDTIDPIKEIDGSGVR